MSNEYALGSSVDHPKYWLLPETQIDDFSTNDLTISFYSMIRAICLRSETRPHVLDFGAGRAGWIEDDPSHFRRRLRHLDQDVAHVVAADVDPVVRENQASSERVVLESDKPLPFADSSFDIIIADWTFEHIENVEKIASELARVVRSGGWICARTPNLWGYGSLVSGLVPNRFHIALLRYIQPQRKEIDVFPTFYRLNTISALRRAFPECEVLAIRRAGPPAYHFNRRWAFATWLFVHRILPAFFAPTFLIFIRKRS